MIDYVEIRNASSRELVGIVDTAKSIIWTSRYYGVGDFEVYCSATPEHIRLLKIGNLVTRHNNREVGIIQKINIITNEQDGRMIAASGRFAKTILGQRIIYQWKDTYHVYHSKISGDVADCCWKLIYNNCVNNESAVRNFSGLSRGAYVTGKTLVDENGNATSMFVAYDNLLTFTDSLLKEYELGAFMSLEEGIFRYNIYAGADRTAGNDEGNRPLIFSSDFDNLVSVDYTLDKTSYRNTAIIGGEGEGVEQFVSRYGNINSGFDRYEMYVDGSGIARTFKEDGAEEETTLSQTEYASVLQESAKQQVLSLPVIESFSGELDLMNSNLRFGTDYNVGDLVTVQDNDIGKLANVRITVVTEVQDDTGYMISGQYGS